MRASNRGLFGFRRNTITVLGLGGCETTRIIIPPKSERLGCPFCAGSLDQLRTQDIDVYGCRSCSGVWFDAGTLKAYRFAVAQLNGQAVEPINFEVAEPSGGGVCPRCRETTLEAGEDGGLKLFRCRRCSGFFLPEQTGPLDWDPVFDGLELAFYLGCETDPADVIADSLDGFDVSELFDGFDFF